ncbi:DgyrCDS1277 [Dimorphilus gyrociliatus]|uniref:DgyrCDS1277 n=1 Tax=Dimorphilus gyrociliatus TaxID=2664684 RepID=A0A7I8V6Y0_9ANNE|nr:DgyrCDS1277 [Dimorphilus gyrociliatus]
MVKKLSVASILERKRRASDELSMDSSKTSETTGEDLKDDEEENEEEDEEKLASSGFDPERLKAFNMFVRLFVDENLDRSVPISKQPKDKVQAILEACDRQFPEFHERARKRIRTYLKSCRRMKRTKENGWESMRPTPPHLTSAAAEGLLAQACENEANNAKRMRMGLDPVPANQTINQPSHATLGSTGGSQSVASISPPAPAREGISGVDMTRPNVFRSHELSSPFSFTNGNLFFRPGFPTAYAGVHPLGLAPPLHSLQNVSSPPGPADLSMKKLGSGKNVLNSTEINTIKTLIAGYRESAAFLAQEEEDDDDGDDEEGAEKEEEEEEETKENGEKNRLQQEVVNSLTERTVFKDEQIRELYNEFLSNSNNGYMPLDAFGQTFRRYFPSLSNWMSFITIVKGNNESEEEKIVFNFHQYAIALNAFSCADIETVLEWSYDVLSGYDEEEGEDNRLNYKQVKTVTEALRSVINDRGDESSSIDFNVSITNELTKNKQDVERGELTERIMNNSSLKPYLNFLRNRDENRV